MERSSAARVSTFSFSFSRIVRSSVRVHSAADSAYSASRRVCSYSVNDDHMAVSDLMSKNGTKNTARRTKVSANTPRRA